LLNTEELSIAIDLSNRACDTCTTPSLAPASISAASAVVLSAGYWFPSQGSYVKAENLILPVGCKNLNPKYAHGRSLLTWYFGMKEKCL
jgi:hypothetical protein